MSPDEDNAPKKPASNEDAIRGILDGILQRVRPSPEERYRLRRTADNILSRIEKTASSKGLNCQGILVGSAARDTWLSGDHDLDVFIAVPPEGDLDEALCLARQIAPVHEEKYAEHAYVHAVVAGFELDLVPCFKLKTANRIKSAVDRTPFHTAYVSSRIPGLEDQVLLLKQFMKGIGVYGSELRVRGFSGYLTEILVLHYGSFLGVLEGASSWRPGETIDLEDHAALSRKDPLVVVDPVDPRRNVAAALSLDRMFQFVTASRCFLRDPSEEYFFPKQRMPLSDEEILAWLKRRGTSLVMVAFEAPAVVEDVLFPQLRKAEEAVRALLERGGFSVLRSDVVWYGAVGALGGNGCAGILFDLEVWELPAVRRHAGPPVWEREHLERFLFSHEPVSGPYVDGGRVVVEVARRYSTAVELLKEEVPELSLGRHVSRQVRAGYRIYEGEGLLKIQDPGFRIFIRSFFEAKQPIC